MPAHALCACCCSGSTAGVQLDLGLAAPSRDVEHIAAPDGACGLERIGEGFDAEFGFEAAAMHVLVAERLGARARRGLAGRRGEATRKRWRS